MASRTRLEVTGISFMSFVPEGYTDLLTFLASN
jgi:hypothetical protein